MRKATILKRSRSLAKAIISYARQHPAAKLAPKRRHKKRRTRRRKGTTRRRTSRKPKGHKRSCRCVVCRRRRR